MNATGHPAASESRAPMAARAQPRFREHAGSARPWPIVRVAVALGLGLLTTLGVTWYFASRERAMSVFADPGTGRVGEGVPCWRVRTWAFVGYTTQNCSPVYTEGEARVERPYPGAIQAWSMAAAPPAPDLLNGAGDRDYVWFGETAAGWPFKALRGWVKYDGRADRSQHPNYAVEEHGWWAFTLRGRDFRLPVQPVWSGLLGNTLLAGLAWWVVLLAPGVARRGLRRVRGRCVGCGYSREGLGEGQACPECGRSSPLSARS